MEGESPPLHELHILVPFHPPEPPSATFGTHVVLLPRQKRKYMWMVTWWWLTGLYEAQDE